MRRDAAIEDLLRSFYDAMRRGDADDVLLLIEDGPDFVGIGTDPAEWWLGKAEFARIVREQFAVAGNFAVREHAAEGYSEGSVGWVSDQAVLDLPEGGTTGIRFSAVAVRRDDGWKFVQLHTSIGVPNVEVLGLQLPQ